VPVRRGSNYVVVAMRLPWPVRVAVNAYVETSVSVTPATLVRLTARRRGQDLPHRARVWAFALPKPDCHPGGTNSRIERRIFRNACARRAKCDWRAYKCASRKRAGCKLPTTDSNNNVAGAYQCRVRPGRIAATRCCGSRCYSRRAL